MDKPRRIDEFTLTELVGSFRVREADEHELISLLIALEESGHFVAPKGAYAFTSNLFSAKEYPKLHFLMEPEAAKKDHRCRSATTKEGDVVIILGGRLSAGAIAEVFDKFDDVLAAKLAAFPATVSVIKLSVMTQFLMRLKKN